MTTDTSPDALAIVTQAAMAAAYRQVEDERRAAWWEAGRPDHRDFSPFDDQVAVAAIAAAYASRVSTPAGGVELPCDRYGETALDRISDHAENGTMEPQFREDLRTLVALSAPIANAGERETDSAFLSDLAARMFRSATPALGFDQGDTDRLHRIARDLATPRATPPIDAAERMREAAAQVADEKVLDVEYEARDCGRSLHEQERAEIAIAKRIAAAIRALPLPSTAVPADVDGLRAEVYVASRASLSERGEMWRAHRASGVPINSTWIDEDGPKASRDLSDLWDRIRREVTRAERLVLYVEPGDFPLKGALIEVGMALAAQVPVVVVAPNVTLEPRNCRPLGSWIKSPLVHFADTVDQAFALAIPGDSA